MAVATASRRQGEPHFADAARQEDCCSDWSAGVVAAKGLAPASFVVGVAAEQVAVDFGVMEIAVAAVAVLVVAAALMSVASAAFAVAAVVRAADFDATETEAAFVPVMQVAWSAAAVAFGVAADWSSAASFVAAVVPAAEGIARDAVAGPTVGVVVAAVEPAARLPAGKFCSAVAHCC